MNRDEFFYLLGDDHWSNTACIGYAVKTCKALNYSKNEIDAFVTILNAMFSNFTLEEAEEEYRKI